MLNGGIRNDIGKPLETGDILRITLDIDGHKATFAYDNHKHLNPVTIPLNESSFGAPSFNPPYRLGMCFRRVGWQITVISEMPVVEEVQREVIYSPSTVALDTAIEDAVILQRTWNDVLLRWKRLGPLYDMVVPEQDVVWAHCKSEDGTMQSSTPAEASMSETITQSQRGDAFVNSAAQSFINMVCEFASSGAPTSSAAPAVVALRTSLTQGWKPKLFPREFLVILVKMLHPKMPADEFSESSATELLSEACKTGSTALNQIFQIVVEVLRSELTYRPSMLMIFARVLETSLGLNQEDFASSTGEEVDAQLEQMYYLIFGNRTKNLDLEDNVDITSNADEKDLATIATTSLPGSISLAGARVEMSTRATDVDPNELLTASETAISTDTADSSPWIKISLAQPERIARLEFVAPAEHAAGFVNTRISLLNHGKEVWSQNVFTRNSEGEPPATLVVTCTDEDIELCDTIRLARLPMALRKTNSPFVLSHASAFSQAVSAPSPAADASAATPPTSLSEERASNIKAGSVTVPQLPAALPNMLDLVVELDNATRTQLNVQAARLNFLQCALSLFEETAASTPLVTKRTTGSKDSSKKNLLKVVTSEGATIRSGVPIESTYLGVLPQGAVVEFTEKSVASANGHPEFIDVVRYKILAGPHGAAGWISQQGIKRSNPNPVVELFSGESSSLPATAQKEQPTSQENDSDASSDEEDEPAIPKTAGVDATVAPLSTGFASLFAPTPIPAPTSAFSFDAQSPPIGTKESAETHASPPIQQSAKRVSRILFERVMREILMVISTFIATFMGHFGE